MQLELIWVPNGTKSHHYYINLRTMAIFMPAELLFVYESSYLYISVPICNQSSYLYTRVPICNQSSYLYISVPICTSEFLFL